MIGLELGIDEAGRGSVLGPLVMAGILIPENRADCLKEWGVADSKSFGSEKKGKQRRAELADKLAENFQHEIVTISPQKVDYYVTVHSLNHLEQITASAIIRNLPAEKTILDGATLFAKLTNGKVQAINKADQQFSSVAAASILAKSARDKIFDQLCQRYRMDYGVIRGGGYANPHTLQFVKWYLNIHKTLPPFYRKSYNWKDLM